MEEHGAAGQLPGDSDPMGVAALGVALSRTTIPKDRPGLVRRARLLDHLTAAESPIVEIVAPAGYGKTTLLGQWCRHDQRRTAWLSLEEPDNDPISLLRGTIAALNAVEPVPNDLIRRLSTNAISATSPLRVGALFISRIQEPFVLIFDHFEALSDPLALDVVEELAASMPNGSSIAIASRSQPDLHTARLRAEGRVTEIGSGQLRMDLPEARELVLASGAVLDEDELDELLERTEGWPTGLYLACIIRRQDPSAAATIAFHGDHRIIADYLRDEVLARLGKHTMSFLLRTSILERLSGPLCDDVLEISGSQRMLESLESENLLIVPLDETRQWYRYHHLLQEMLQTELAKQSPDEVAGLHSRAAAWFEESGHPAPAISHAQSGNDEAMAAAMLTRHAISEFANGRRIAVRRWVEWFERRGALERYPEIAVVGGLIEAMTGHQAEARHLAETCSHTQGTAIQPDGSPVEAWCSVLRAAICELGVEQMRADAEYAVEELPETNALRPGALTFLALAHMLAGDAREADRVLELTNEAAVLLAEHPAHAAALALQATLAIDRHDWQAARPLAQQALDVVYDNDLDDYMSALPIFAVASRLAAHQGDIVRASELANAAHRLRPLCTSACPSSALFLLQLAHANLALADPAGARSVLLQVRDILAGHPGLGIVTEQAAKLRTIVNELGTGTIGVSSLTASELRILPLLATYLTLQEIADRLFLSRHTVKSHSLSIYRKVGVTSRSEAVEVLSAAGLVDPALPSS